MASLCSSSYHNAVGGASDLNVQPYRRDPPPYPVVQYIERYRNRLDRRRFAVIQLAGSTKEIRDVRTERMCDTAVGAWIKRWWHWGGRGPTDYLYHFQDNDSTYAQCFGEAGYKRNDGDVLSHLRNTASPA